MPVWHAGVADDDSANPWDVCYSLLSGGKASGGNALTGSDQVVFAEPDLEQAWTWTGPQDERRAIVDACDWIQPPLGPPFAPAKNPFWYREAAQLAQAQEAVTIAAGGPRVRIAHLDTGYDPSSLTKPPRHDAALSAGFPGDDPANGSSHGTFTLALLAGVHEGQPLGAAADLDVFSLHIADGVVRFRTRRLAEAFNYVHKPNANGTPVHVVTLSMGGVASAAWADAINALYEAGVVVVAAAGNTFLNSPISTVYPARFQRVIAVTGVMANGCPYSKLGWKVGGRLTGCYGPESKLRTSLAGCTPNVARARAGCRNTVDANGQGTSAATPQVASAAALWIQKNFRAWNAEREGWRRVEMVRQALFEGAHTDPDADDRLGRGALRAHSALEHRIDTTRLKMEAPDNARFPIFKVLFGRSFAADRRQPMLELEALQIAGRDVEVQALVGQTDLSSDSLEPQQAREILSAIADSPSCSQTLRERLGSVLSRTTPRTQKGPRPSGAAIAQVATSMPPSRPLRVYAFDPLLATRLETQSITNATLDVRWEAELAPGPVGEYLEVVDIDPASGQAYLPVDLNQPELLAQRGHAPNEGNPQFHQQMVYAVAMKTIQHFERALGRVALWAERKAERNGKREWSFIRRLRIYPHALREANAYYDPTRAALLFGYFQAGEGTGDNLPGGLVFTCLSHDVVAHETTHALLDGLHPRYKEPTNPDTDAFHEAFADIVALFQHFTIPEALRQQLAQARGDLESARLLGGLAVQFGEAIGNRGALRHAIGEFDQDRKWVRHQPSPSDYSASGQPHQRGAVLVSAVFDAFLQIYKYRTDSLVRLATQGTGILPPGQIPHELVEQLAKSAATSAAEVLRICIRALDYCPPVDLTFGEYLRALVTADHDLVADDTRGYRVAFISAFRARGIYPEGVRSLAPESVLWQAPPFRFQTLSAIIRDLQLTWAPSSKRYDAYESSKQDAMTLHRALLSPDFDDTEFNWLGLLKTQKPLDDYELEGRRGRVSRVEVHSVRPARRVGPGGEHLTEVVIEITQSFLPHGQTQKERGGVTLICSPESGEVRYVIRKRVGHRGRAAQQRAFTEGQQLRPLQANYDPDALRRSPFACMHRGL